MRFVMGPAHTRLPRLFLLLVAVAEPSVSLLADPQSQITSYGPLPVFELHSGFWFNLHHTLYHQARERDAAPRNRSTTNKNPRNALGLALDTRVALSSSEQRIWDDALAYYSANYASKDLQFTTELILLKNQLGDFEDCDELSGTKKQACDAGLSPGLTHVLESAAPIYRAHQWPNHDRANRRWILQVAPLVRQQGVGLSERLADLYQAKWPREKIRVDVARFANTAGAYTTLDPLRVTISSADPRNQGAAALEVLFHEASHGIAEPVQDAIIRECRQRGKAIPRDLWHALIFYTTGEVIRPVMTGSHLEQDRSVPGGGYTPYAVREGLYQRGWDAYFKLLQKFWQPYLDGKATFDDSIARMVSAL
ncbi:MAG TPA: hypothetical protein VOA64_13855 [Candidatus Dormibacteraeota bacterium]|nr:hypothetical protein [Candidatus Dormibacteraeota bacterium]